MRELAVTEAMPQKNWATAQMKTSATPREWPAASMKICAGGRPMLVVRALSMFWIDAVMATSRTQPAKRETTTEFTMPLGALTDAEWVSSATWAEAWKPVKVYCAMSRPMRNT